MDLITADPSTQSASSSSNASSNPAPSSSASSPAPIYSTTAQPTALGKPVLVGEKRSKRSTLMQIQNDTISAAKAVKANIMPSSHRQKKKVVH